MLAPAASNSASSMQKTKSLLAEGGIDWIRKPTRLVFRRADQPEIREELKLEKHADAAARILDDLQAGPSAALQVPKTSEL